MSEFLRPYWAPSSPAIMVQPMMFRRDMVDLWELSFPFYGPEIKKSKFILLVERCFWYWSKNLHHFRGIAKNWLKQKIFSEVQYQKKVVLKICAKFEVNRLIRKKMIWPTSLKNVVSRKTRLKL